MTRLFLSILFACIKASAVAGFLFGLAIATTAYFFVDEGASVFAAPLLTATLAAIAGPFFAFPAILLGVILWTYYGRKLSLTRSQLSLFSALLFGTYGALLQAMTSFDHFLFFLLAGSIAGWEFGETCKKKGLQ